MVCDTKIYACLSSPFNLVPDMILDHWEKQDFADRKILTVCLI